MSPNRTSRLALASAIVLALGADGAAAVNTVHLDPGGVGQVLLYPYYTVNGGNDTYVSIVNTKLDSKAVKLRFREARNARPVLEFNLYLGAYDVWTGALFSLDANGPANLLTQDTSCTVPKIRDNTSLAQTATGARYVPFRNFAYAAASTDGGPGDLTRTREGFLEVIEMGTLRVGSGLTQVVEEINHNGNVNSPPSGCDQVVNDWQTDGQFWAANRMFDINLPTGGLYGSAQIIDVANGTLHAYDATAIDGFYGGNASEGGLHFAPGSGRPTLADASDGSTSVKSQVLLRDGSSLVSSWVQGTADAVSAVLMHTEVDGEFEFDPAIGARSEWVLSFPTKPLYTDTPGAPRAPFTQVYSGTGTGCEPTNAYASGREQETTRDSCSTDTAGNVACNAKPNVCGAVAVAVPLAAGSAALIRSPIFKSGDNASGAGTASPWAIANASHGSANISFPQGLPNNGHALISLEGDRYVGLPVVGLGAVNYINGQAQPGKLGNYSGSVPLRTQTQTLRLSQ